MRCVVLGGGGFIGSNLCRRLEADGHRVLAVDVEFPEWRRPPVDCWTLDLLNPGACSQAILSADYVFHLAADMGGVGYFHGPADLQAAMTNAQITLNVLGECVRLDVPVFYSASACAYPIERQMLAGAAPLLGEVELGHGTPDALYGSEKLQGIRWCSKIPGARVGVFHTIFGPLQEHEGRRMKFPAAVATKAIAARRTGRLELWGDGQQLRSYLHVDDAVERIVRVAFADHYEGPVNVGAEGAVTCDDIARLCLRIAGAADAEIVHDPAEPSGVLARDCDNTKFDSLYGPGPQRSYEDGFASMIDWLDSL